MAKSKCKATTAKEVQCNLHSKPSGYCHIHDPENIAARKAAKKAAEEQRKSAWARGNRLREVIDAVHNTCKAKGWTCSTTNQDEKEWRYATVSVERLASSGEVVRGEFHVTVGNGVKISRQTTSFHSYGLEDLHDAIMSELKRLPWLHSADKPQQEHSVTNIDKVEQILQRFHLVARQLKHRHSQRRALVIRDEYDVQDLLHALLNIVSDDVRPEEYTPSYAGAASRMDFLIKQEKLVIETKMASSKLTDKAIGEQLVIDINRYQSHPDCKTLLCLVYDPESNMKNPSALENDLTGKHNDLNVRLIVVPK
jgi:hypothetical protein